MYCCINDATTVADLYQVPIFFHPFAVAPPAPDERAGAEDAWRARKPMGPLASEDGRRRCAQNDHDGRNARNETGQTKK